jgi:hypothetical protein
MSTYHFIKVGRAAKYKINSGASISVDPSERISLDVSADGKMITFRSQYGTRIEMTAADTILLGAEEQELTGTMEQIRDQLMTDVFFLAEPADGFTTQEVATLRQIIASFTT